MEIVSWNVNGIRAACDKGFLDWLGDRSPDVLCLQEIKADVRDLPDSLKQVPRLEELGGYNTYWNPSKRKGHSGVGVLTKQEPLEVNKSLVQGKFGDDGRVLVVEVKDFKLVNVYVPHGKRDKSGIPVKLEMYEDLLKFLEKQQKDVILCGDFNVAHRELDLERPDQNRDNTMFTQEERKQIDRILDRGYIDAFRSQNPGEKKYTWWPYAHNARERDLGWRIDYFFIPKNLQQNLENAFILNDVKGSDHCPLGIEIELENPN